MTQPLKTRRTIKNIRAELNKVASWPLQATEAIWTTQVATNKDLTKVF